MDSYTSHRKKLGFYHRVYPTLKNHPKLYYNHMRMKLETFEYLLSKIEMDLHRDWCNFHKIRIEPEEMLVVTIRFLVTGSTYSELSTLFFMVKSTVYKIIKETLESLWLRMRRDHMPSPTTQSLLDSAEEFHTKWNIPHCCGSIDVKHIRIKKPPGSGGLYFNRKKFFSIALQAVVDANYKFICVDVGGYGRQHDATTFRCSKFYHCLKQKKIQFPPEEPLYRTHDICSYFLIGDGAYPLSKNLLKPYGGKKLLAWKRLYNRRFSRARQTVECAFGHLCQKFMIFYGTIQQLPAMAELITKTACVLCNVLITRERTIIRENVDLYAEADSDSSLQVENEVFSVEGEETREKIFNYFLHHPIR